MRCRKEYDHKIDWLVLSQLPGIGISSFWKLVDHFGSPEEVLQSSPGDFLKAAGIRAVQLDAVGQKEQVAASCAIHMERTRQMGAELISFDDEDYPASLKEISDPPPVLFVLGNTEILSTPAVAVVGSRSATSYGRRVAYTVSKKLATQGVTIVSGLALGIDAESHRGALEANGRTIAVLGCGLDVMYPKSNAALQRMVAEMGVVVSEYPPGTTPEGFRFPARNRIIAGMSRGVLVVEAAKRSGSLITAQLALEEGREVFAVPGQVDSYKSEGTHWLLKQGAKLVQSEMDILDELQMAAVFPGSSWSEQAGEVSGLDTREQSLLKQIESYPVARDELLRKSGLGIADFSEALLMLELDGLIEILPGDEVCRR